MLALLPGGSPKRFHYMIPDITESGYNCSSMSHEIEGFPLAVVSDDCHHVWSKQKALGGSDWLRAIVLTALWVYQLTMTSSWTWQLVSLWAGTTRSVGEGGLHTVLVKQSLTHHPRAWESLANVMASWPISLHVTAECYDFGSTSL